MVFSISTYYTRRMCTHHPHNTHTLSMIPAHVPGSPACPRLGEAARLGCLKHLGGFVGADAAVSQHVASTTIKRLRNLGSLRFVRDT